MVILDTPTNTATDWTPVVVSVIMGIITILTTLISSSGTRKVVEANMNYRIGGLEAGQKKNTHDIEQIKNGQKDFELSTTNQITELKTRMNEFDKKG